MHRTVRRGGTRASGGDVNGKTETGTSAQARSAEYEV
jgi:hypothetical protein